MADTNLIDVIVASAEEADDGIAEFWCGAAACYDNVQTAWNQIAWSFGGELWDPAKYKVDGILNSPENIAALDIQLTPDDLREIDSAASKITVQGARYSEKLEQMTGR